MNNVELIAALRYCGIARSRRSGFAVSDHFADVGKMVDIGSEAERNDSENPKS